MIAALVGLLTAAFFGWTAWEHNPQGEFHLDGAPTSDFYVLILISFVLGAGVILLLSTAVKYLKFKDKGR